MSSLLYVKDKALVHHRTAVTLLRGQFRKSGQNVQFGKYAAVGLYLGDVLLDEGDQVRIDAGLQGVDFLLGAEYLGLVLLEFLRDVSFRAYEGLLAHPFRRDLVPEGVADLQVVAEHVVVVNLERRDACALALALLHLLQVFAAVEEYGAELVQFRVDAGGYDLALANCHGGVLLHDAADFLKQPCGGVEPCHQFVQGLAAFVTAHLGYGGALRQAACQLYRLSRAYPSGGGAGQDPLKVSHVAHECLQLRKLFRPLQEVLYNVVTIFKFLEVQQRHCQPASQKARSHGGAAAVHDIHQRRAVAPCGVENLQVAQRELVHPDE